MAGQELPMPVNGDSKLYSVISKACAYDPAARYREPSDMKNALIEARSGEVKTDVSEYEYEDEEKTIAKPMPFNASPLADAPTDHTYSDNISQAPYTSAPEPAYAADNKKRNILLICLMLLVELQISYPIFLRHVQHENTYQRIALHVVHVHVDHIVHDEHLQRVQHRHSEYIAVNQIHIA